MNKINVGAIGLVFGLVFGGIQVNNLLGSYQSTVERQEKTIRMQVLIIKSLKQKIQKIQKKSLN